MEGPQLPLSPATLINFLPDTFCSLGLATGSVWRPCSWGELLGKRKLPTAQVLLGVMSYGCKLGLQFQVLSLLLGFVEHPDS